MLERMEGQRRGQQDQGEWKAVQRGWCRGDQRFREALLAQRSGEAGEPRREKEKQESAEQPAARMVLEEVSRRGWAEDELKRRRRGDREKLEIAVRLQRETATILKWIAERLSMGTWTNVASCLAKAEKNVKGRD